jgi:uncharacterized membrane protein (DUF106 family)
MVSKENKGLLIYFIVLLVSIFIAGQWNAEIFGQKDFLKNTIGLILNPTLGILIKFNVYVGFIIIVALTSLILTLAQKYLSNQVELKELRKEQKLLQEEMKKYKDHPDKLMELNKKQLEFIPKTFNLTMKPLMYTSIPIILLFRWFGEALNPIFGGWWILYYLIGSLIFSSIFRKVFDVA